MLKGYFLFYGIILFAGGIIGARSGSSISLFMGIISGVCVLTGLYLMSVQPRSGTQMLTVISGVLTAVFLQRLISTGAFLPGGLLFILSLFACVLGIVHLTRFR